MTAKQTAVSELIMKGHNVIITGQAGTGKTYLAIQVASNLKKKGKNVSVVCSTGKAASLYPSSLEATTLHRWAGIQDGRHSQERLIELITTDEAYSSVKQRITNVDVLVIDEVSMISKKIVDILNTLCQSIRGFASHPFGGIQIVLVGDFYQLGPVPNLMYNDEGDYSLMGKKSNIYKKW